MLKLFQGEPSRCIIKEPKTFHIRYECTRENGMYRCSFSSLCLSLFVCLFVAVVVVVNKWYVHVLFLPFFFVCLFVCSLLLLLLLSLLLLLLSLLLLFLVAVVAAAAVSVVVVVVVIPITLCAKGTTK